MFGLEMGQELLVFLGLTSDKSSNSLLPTPVWVRISKRLGIAKS
jgi:hypothetical protein